MVVDNGTLEMHGQKKMSWTKLAHTIPPAQQFTCGLIYEHEVYTTTTTTTTTTNNNNNNNNNKADFQSAHLPHKVAAQGALQ